MKNRTPVSLSMLKRLAKSGNREALGLLGVLQLKGLGIPQEVQKGRINLLCAARSKDRMSGCRLALYYKVGMYGFDVDFDKADYWRARVTDWLYSDAALQYNDIQLKKDAVSRFKRWKSVCGKLWGISL